MAVVAIAALFPATGSMAVVDEVAVAESDEPLGAPGETETCAVSVAIAPTTRLAVE